VPGPEDPGSYTCQLGYLSLQYGGTLHLKENARNKRGQSKSPISPWGSLKRGGWRDWSLEGRQPSLPLFSLLSSHRPQGPMYLGWQL
jgi:hypothetical protein